MDEVQSSQGKIGELESIITNFLYGRGHIVYVSQDRDLRALLRQALSKYLNVDPDVHAMPCEPGELLRVLRSLCQQKSPLVLMERTIDGKENAVLVEQVERTFPEARIIILTEETEQQKVVFFQELGAKSIIVKPISVVGLLEKMAYVIRPLGKFGQLLDMAHTLLDQEEPQLALEICKQAVQIKSDSAAVFMIVGDCFRMMGDYEKARNAYEEACRSAPTYLTPLQKLADMYAFMGENKKHLEILCRLDALSPLNTDRKMKMGEVALSLGQMGKAREYLSSALAAVTREGMAYAGAVAQRAAMTCMETDAVAAERFLRRALELKASFLNRDDVPVVTSLGLLLRRQGKWREALAEYAKVAKFVTDDALLFYNMALACSDGHDFIKAQECLNRALSLNPRLPRQAAEIASNMGIIFMKGGKRDKARDLLYAALEMDPEHASAKAAMTAL